MVRRMKKDSLEQWSVIIRLVVRDQQRKAGSKKEDGRKRFSIPNELESIMSSLRISSLRARMIHTQVGGSYNCFY